MRYNYIYEYICTHICSSVFPICFPFGTGSSCCFGFGPSLRRHGRPFIFATSGPPLHAGELRHLRIVCAQWMERGTGFHKDRWTWYEHYMNMCFSRASDMFVVVGQNLDPSWQLCSLFDALCTECRTGIDHDLSTLWTTYCANWNAHPSTDILELGPFAGRPSAKIC